MPAEQNNKRTAEKSPEGLDYQWSMVCGPDRSYLWILSRTPTMAPATWKMLTDKARSVAPSWQKLDSPRNTRFAFIMCCEWVRIELRDVLIAKRTRSRLLMGFVFAFSFAVISGCGQSEKPAAAIELVSSPCNLAEERSDSSGVRAHRVKSQECEAVVVVRRHSDDRKDGDYNPKTPQGDDTWTYTFPDGVTQTTPWRRLTEDGDRIAQYFGSNLSIQLAGLDLAGGEGEPRYPCPIDRVITIDPTSRDATQNPFETAFPFIIEKDLTSDQVILLSERQIGQDLPPESFLGESGNSTLVVATRQALWVDDGEGGSETTISRLLRGCDPGTRNCNLSDDDWKPSKVKDYLLFSNFCPDDNRYHLQKVGFSGRADLLEASKPMRKE